MPFDPNVPAFNAELTSAMFRGQFNGLKDLIDAASGITAVVVDAVNTLPAGSAASVDMQVSGNTLHFTFGIPEGQPGPQGTPGNDGAPGQPFAQAVVDAVNTVDPGSPASVSVNFDGTNVRFTFDIPRGQTGDTGATGQPGEVSQTDLQNAVNDALQQCSNNSNAVGTLDAPMADPDAETLRNAYNTLVLALRR
jgi:hypothetical protein